MSPDQYSEIRYEDFVSDTENATSDMLRFSALDPDEKISSYIAQSPRLVNMNKKYEEDFPAEYVRLLTDAMQPSLEQFSYR